eukprot:scaffold181418_cov32-Tisochrysis_lutea.AAC.1
MISFVTAHAARSAMCVCVWVEGYDVTLANRRSSHVARSSPHPPLHATPPPSPPPPPSLPPPSPPARWRGGYTRASEAA